MRSFVILGRSAASTEQFSLDDLAGSSGRLDVLVRCVRAALLCSHGVRRDAEIFLVLGGGELAPRTARVRGESAKFLRPEERSLATLLQKSLASRADLGAAGFSEVRPGVSLAQGGLELVLAELGERPLYALSETGEDVRDVELAEDAVLVVGDHGGYDDATLESLRARGATLVSLGPVSIHSDDAVAVMNVELDRQGR